MIAEPGKTYVRTLRATVSERSGYTLETRLGGLLAGADLHPRGLPAEAIVCVRRVRDPRPGSLHLSGGVVRPSLEWEQAARDALDETVRHAVRPARGPLPAAAEAVLFLDRAELLACMAADRCNGSLPLRWWWRSLLGNGDLVQVTEAAWLEAPHYVPAALQILSEHGQAVAFVRSLPMRTAAAVLERVIQTFALAGLEIWPAAPATLDGSAPTGAVVDRSRVAAPNAASAESSYTHGHETMRTPAAPITPNPTTPSPWHQPLPKSEDLSPTTPSPWRQWVPESEAPGLDPIQRALLGTALLLLRSPGTARSDSFGAAVHGWLHAQSPAGGEQAPPATGAENQRAPVTTRPAAGARSLSPANTVEPGVPIEPPPPTTLHSSTAVQPSLDYLSTSEVETEYGGLFYLINLGLFLGLYGDFTNPLHPGIALSIWQFVAAVGRELLGDAIEADPVWSLLTGLAGLAEHEPLGTGFRPHRDWRVPQPWLAPLPRDGIWRWSSDRGRLRIAHPAGFLVLDLPLRAGDPARQAQRMLRAYAEGEALDLQRGEVPRGPSGSGPFRRWLDRLMPYLRVRLRWALGTGDPGRLLCVQHGRIAVTATHLTVKLRLAELPIEVRLAGLDRDPGWVPAAGRFIDFEFE